MLYILCYRKKFKFAMQFFTLYAKVFPQICCCCIKCHVHNWELLVVVSFYWHQLLANFLYKPISFFLCQICTFCPANNQILKSKNYLAFYVLQISFIDSCRLQRFLHAICIWSRSSKCKKLVAEIKKWNFLHYIEFSFLFVLLDFMLFIILVDVLCRKISKDLLVVGWQFFVTWVWAHLFFK